MCTYMTWRCLNEAMKHIFLLWYQKKKKLIHKENCFFKKDIIILDL